MPIKIYSVKEITFQIRDILEGNFYGLWIKGEISSLRQSATGHVYFNLVDDVASLGCIIYKNYLPNITIKLENGKEVIAFGSLSVYIKGGEYRLKIEHLQESGVGKRFYDLEQLKKEFKAKGYFDRKRPIPAFPNRILLITSPTGAAIQDIIKIIKRRAMGMEILVLPISVQGDSAKESIIQALRLTNTIEEDIDVTILARGGGSNEDLWVFNDPDIAKALFDVKFPTISAIGHEIDFTLCDFVADRRAETPSAAAEILTKPSENTLDQLINLSGRIQMSIKRILTQKSQQIKLYSPKNNFSRLMSMLDNKAIYLDRLTDQLESALRKLLNIYEKRILVAKEKITSNSPNSKIEILNQKVERYKTTINSSINRIITEKRNSLNLISSKIRYVSPLNILKKGYSITMNNKGKIIKEAGFLKKGEQIKTIVYKGEIISTVDKIEEKRG